MTTGSSISSCVELQAGARLDPTVDARHVERKLWAGSKHGTHCPKVKGEELATQDSITRGTKILVRILFSYARTSYEIYENKMHTNTQAG